MAKPVLLTVDDEPQVLNAIARDLRQRYGADYRVMKAGSGDQALELLRALNERDAAVALILADQRMPGMSGTELLEQAKPLHPRAKTALLTAYADTQAAIESINTVGLDYYLQKPWDPPEQQLYPVVDDLLLDWVSNVPPAWDGVRVAGTMWSAGSHDTKDFLARNRVPFLWVDVDKDDEMRARCEALAQGAPTYPVVFLPDGKVLTAPTNLQLAERVGMKTTAERPMYDLIIVGGGPGGLGAAVYGASEGLTTVMIEREATGGQAGTSSLIENYLGFPSGITGADLASRAVTQATRFGAELLSPQEVVSIEVEQPYKHITLSDGSRLSCYALLLCPGMEVRQADAPGIRELTGRGIYYGAALTEAAHYKGERAVVIGGGNSAGQGAKYFSRYASQVTILVRSHISKSMSQYLIDQIDAIDNIEVRNGFVITQAKGDGRLQSVVVEQRDTGEQQELDAASMYIFIGSKPRTGLVADLCALDAKGFVLTGNDVVSGGHATPGHLPAHLETSVPGIFAAGDCRSGSQKRVASAVGEGAVAVALVHSYLSGVR